MSCLPTSPRLDVAPTELAAFGGMGYKYCAPTELLPMLNPGLEPG
jgi:hypothetical protein